MRMPGFHHTAETIAKLRRPKSPEHKEACRLAQNRPEVRERNSLAHRGKIKSPETREKLRLARLGIPLSLKHRTALSLAHIGGRGFLGPHSIETKKKLSIILTGKKGPDSRRWKGGKSKSTPGYILIYSPKHPATFKGYILEHRLVAEKSLGRFLKKGECVHHINNIKNDNRPENLIVFGTIKEHSKFHQEMRRR